MAIPQIMSRIWDGDPNEYFTAGDMRRVEDNMNIISRYAGVPEIVYAGVTRASQFDYSQAQIVEDRIRAVGDALGVQVRTEDHWNYNRTVSFRDFERWEGEQWKLYRALGGLGDRIPSDKFLHTVTAILFAEDWRDGDRGTHYIDLDMPAIRDGMDATVYVAENATVEERADEFNALLQMVPTGPQRVRVWALGLKPNTNIPIRITTKEWNMSRNVVLSAQFWKGSGPWTQTVDVGGRVPACAVIGINEANTPEAVRQAADAVISVSRLNGPEITVRAIGKKPTEDIQATVLWAPSEVA